MKEKKVTRRDALFAGISAMAVVVLLLGSFAFSLTERIRNEARQHLEETAAQSVILTRSKVDDTLAALETLASVVGKYDDMTGSEAMRFLKEQTYHALYARLAVALPDGDRYSPDTGVVNVADRAYFQRAIQGESCISDLVTSRVDGEPCIVFSVPIRRGDRVVGTLSGTYHLDRLRDLLATELFGGEGTVTLVKSDGSTITPIQGETDIVNVLDDLELPKGMDRDSLLETAQRGGSGGFTAKYRGEAFLIRYEPVQRGGWYLLATVPARIVNERVGAILLQVMVLLLAALLVLIYWTLCLYRNQKRYDSQIRKDERFLQAIADNVPGGVQICKNDEQFTTLYLSSGFSYLTGYTLEEMDKMSGGSFVRLVNPDDVERVCSSVQRQLDATGFYRVEYRLVTKDGSVRWAADTGRLVEDEETGRTVIYCVVTDITESVRTQQKLRLSEERYRLIMEHTSNILFDWDLQSDRMSFSSVWEKKFGYQTEMESVVQTFSESGLVYPEDLPRLMEMLRRVEAGQHAYVEEVVRIRSAEGEYLWCRACISVIPNEKGVPSRAIGAIFDIDREKRETEDMQRRAERDSLTRLYNKGSFARWARKCLAEDNPENLHALLIVDVDNFKRINDCFGHVCGDSALEAAAEALRGPFRASDIVGRVGGDEFAVFIRGASQTLAGQKALAVCENFRALYVGEENNVRISCSVGIALYPEDGTDYDTLYQHADAALYRAKRGGKNRFCFYSDEDLER